MEYLIVTWPWCWERLKAGKERADRGWDGWMASPTQWTWVWASSRSWWWTGKPVVLQSMGSQRVGHNWMTELSTEYSVTQKSLEKKVERSILLLLHSHVWSFLFPLPEKHSMHFLKVVNIRLTTYTKDQPETKSLFLQYINWLNCLTLKTKFAF